MREYRYTRSKLVESGKYKNIRHTCNNGYVVIELISLGTNYYFQENRGAVKSLNPCTDDRIYKHKKSDLEEGVICLEYYDNGISCKTLHVMYIPPRCETFAKAGSHCNCGSTTIDWQFSIEKGSTETLFYDLLHIQKASFGYF